MINKEEIKKRILEEEDYIYCPKYGNSLSKFLFSNSDGVEISNIARLLMMPEEEVEKIYQEAIETIRQFMVDKQ